MDAMEIEESSESLYPPPPPNKKVSEFALHSTPKKQTKKTKHHIMKFPSQKFKPTSLQPPIKIIRKNKYNEILQQREREKLMAAAKLGDIEKMMEINEDLVMDLPVVAAGEKKFEPAKLMAQLQNQFKKREKPYTPKRKFRVRHGGDDVLDINGEDPMFKHSDPDKYPWLFMTNGDESEQNVYTGNVDNSASNSQYMLFILTENHFKVIPASKFYKFTQKPQYHTLGIDEVEAQMSKRGGSKPVSRWVMHTKMDEDGMGDGSGGGGMKKEQDSKMAIFDKYEDVEEVEVERKGKLLDEFRSATYFVEEKKPKQKRKKAQTDEIDEELDYDEEFEDDEEVNLGMEDEEESKEAQKRIYGRAGKKAFLDEDEDADFEDLLEREITGVGKDIKKSQKKWKKLTNENNGEMSSDEDDEDDEETERERIKKEKEQAQKLNQQMQQQFQSNFSASPFLQHPHQQPGSLGGNGMPVNAVVDQRPLMTPVKVEPASTKQPKVKIPVKLESGSASGPILVQSEFPSPRKVKKEPAKSKTQNSAEPMRLSSPEIDSSIVTENQVRELFQSYASQYPEVTIPMMIATLKPRIEVNEENREIVKNLMRKCFTIKDNAKRIIVLREPK
ncbi:hypothetical protein HK098_001263 [Nowakowskiella sp. JEL0407]|nr:hypothetical protein HK098_001263 [Nowakowskiella sp. JEL0407]